MAIQGNYDISTATGAYKAWYNYKYCGNTLNVSDEDIGKIKANYAREISTTWAERASNDENKYEITNDEKNEAQNKGVERGKDKSDHDGSTDSATSVTCGTAAAAGGVAGVVAAIWAGKVAMKKGSSGSLAGTILALAASGTMLASGTILVAAKPNSEQADACEKLTEEMGTAQGEIAEQEGIMEDADAELQTLSEDAEEANEEANSTNEENHADFSIYQKIYEALMEKVENGEPLTEDEQELLKEIIPIMQELGVEIEETTEDTSDVVNDIYDEMGDYQDVFDDAGEKIEEIQGLTDFAAEFDEATKSNAKYVKTTAELGKYGAMALAGTAGTTALIAGSAKLSNPFTAAIGISQKAMGYTIFGVNAVAATEFGFASKQQGEYAEKAETEIAAREATQDLNANLGDVYDERIDDYDGYMGVVEDLELEVPDDMEIPEEDPEIPTETKQPEETPPEGDVTNPDDDPNKKDEDEKK